MAGTATIALAAFAQPVPAFAQERAFTLNIPAQELGASLRAFARATRLQITFDRRMVQGLRAPALQGNFTAESALGRLLEGSGLSASRGRSGVYIVRQIAGRTPGSGEAEAGSAAADSESAEQAIIVTGTSIRGSAPRSSPLTTYREMDLSRSGDTTVEQFLRKVPQNFSSTDQQTFLSESTSGGSVNVARGSAVNLRGIGVGSTLVLLNGHRLPPSGTSGSFADISIIPLNIISRLELLTDGASAIYGADAVAGVVNFITRDDFSGSDTAISYQTATRGGAESTTISQLLGGRWTTGNAFASYEFNDANGLDARDRSYLNNLGGRFQILPVQRRHSAYGAVSQQLSPTFSLNVDGLYSHRRYAQTFQQFGLTNTQDGESEQFSGTIGLRFDIASDWTFDASSTYGEARLTQFTSLGAFPRGLTSRNRSGVWSNVATASGTLFTMGDRRIRSSIGAELRREAFDNLGSTGALGRGLRRTVASAFAELLAPIVTESDQFPIARAVELSLAARLDNYSDFGSSFNPKIGLMWGLTRDLRLRGTYAESFRAPPLVQRSNSAKGYFIFPFPNTASPTGSTVTAILGADGFPGLEPEESNSFTIGIDYRANADDGFSFSADYFSIDYTNRISTPPVVGSLFDVFNQLDTLAPFVDLDPDLLALAADVAAGADLSDPFGLGINGVEAVVDFRPKNLASSRVSGIDVRGAYAFQVGSGRMTLTGNATWLNELAFRAAPNTPVVRLEDTVFQPADFRARVVGNYSNGGLSLTGALNFVDGYRNQLVTPAQNVRSNTTLDLQLAYQVPEDSTRWTRGFRFALSVQNILDTRPPRIDAPTLFFNLGYDPTNASAVGRLLTVSIAKSF